MVEPASGENRTGESTGLSIRRRELGDLPDQQVPGSSIVGLTPEQEQT